MAKKKTTRPFKTKDVKALMTYRMHEKGYRHVRVNHEIDYLHDCVHFTIRGFKPRKIMTVEIDFKLGQKFTRPQVAERLDYSFKKDWTLKYRRR